MRLRLPGVWPPCTALTVVLTVHAVVVFLTLLYAGPRPAADEASVAKLPVVLIASAILFGSLRVRRFHPIFDPEYRFWLWFGPWTPAKRLPLGPVHLVPADVALVAAGVAAALPYYGLAASLFVAKFFLFAYVFKLMVALFRTGESLAAYAVWFGLGALVLYWSADAPFVISAVATYCAGMVGLRRSLRGFPWFECAPSVRVWARASVGLAASGRAYYGWPFAYLTPGGDNLSLPGRHGAAIALLCGWSVYAACCQLTELFSVMICLLLPLMAASGAAFRLSMYRVGEYRPPISLAGRLQTGRWIIPSYDRVFVAPLLAPVVSILLWVVLLNCELPPILGATTGVCLVLLILLTAGPDRPTWLLTAPSRMVAPNLMTRYRLWA